MFTREFYDSKYTKWVVENLAKLRKIERGHSIDIQISLFNEKNKEIVLSGFEKVFQEAHLSYIATDLTADDETVSIISIDTSKSDSGKKKSIKELDEDIRWYEARIKLSKESLSKKEELIKETEKELDKLKAKLNEVVT